MECERLIKLVKNWYVQVQSETMAPARMVTFMRNHVDGCATCMADPIVEIEVRRIAEIVLPPTKIPKAVRKERDVDEEEEDGSEETVADDEDSDLEGDDGVQDEEEEDDEEEDEDDEI